MFKHLPVPFEVYTGLLPNCNTYFIIDSSAHLLYHVPMAPKASTSKVIVSERALFQRINRKLLPDEEKLMTSRSARMQLDAGRFYIIDIRRNLLLHKDVDLVELGRELKVLQPWEKVE